MKKLFWIFLLVSPAFAQTFSGTAGSDIFIPSPFRFCWGVDGHGDNCTIQSANQETQWTGSLDFKWAFRTVGNLPAASTLNKGRTYEITDGQSSTDCSSGGGTALALCTSDGTNWNAIGSSGSGSGSGGVPSTLPNCTAAGTTLNEGIQFSTQVVSSVTSLCATVAGANSNTVVGLATSGAGASGNVTIAYSGYASCLFDNQTTQGDYVIASANPGQCTDIGASKPAGTVETIGIVSSTNTGGGTLATILVNPLSLYTPGGTNNSGNVNNAAQFQLPWYSAAGNTNVISGGAGTTDGSANDSFNTVKTTAVGTGIVTMSNGAPPGAPASGNSTAYTDSNGNFHCKDSNGTSCLGTTIDVRVGYAGSGGVDCTGVSDSTSILQTMINNAPDFTKFVFPENCKVLVSTSAGSPKAITIQSRTGLEFWFEGRNANGCDTGSSGPGGAAIIDNSAYASGATIWYINQSQRLLFHNVVMRLNGAVDVGFDVDQTTQPPITTANIWENNCIQNNVARNSAFRGWRFSNTAISNMETQQILRSYVQCSSQSATSYTANGYGISFGNNNNQKTEVVDGLSTSGCSQDQLTGSGSDFTSTNFLVSNSYSNVQDGGFNSLVMGVRSENATHAINVTNPIGPHTYIHDDFAASVGSPIDCTQGSPSTGCGFIAAIGNEADNDIDIVNPAATGQNSAGFLVGNRHMTVSQFDWQNGVFNVNANGFNPILNTFGEYLSAAVKPSAITQNMPSAPLVLENAYGTTPSLDTYLVQNLPAGPYGNITNSTIAIGPVLSTNGLGGFATWPGSGITRWLSFPGNQSGGTLSQSPQPSAPTLNNVGTTGATCYTYEIVAHGNTGTTQASATTQTCTGNATLNSSNYVRVSIPSVAGATYYDVYRTQCAGVGICNTNPTGIIGQMAAVVLVNGLQSSASAINLNDTGLSAGGQTAPTVNTTGTLNGSIVNASAAYTVYPALDSSCSVYLQTGTQYCAVSNVDGTRITNTDAAVVINSVLTNLATVGGTIYFKNGVYNLNSATQESNGGCTNFYSIGIQPNQYGSFVQFKFIGEQRPSWPGEIAASSIQTNGVIFNVTSTAITAAGSSMLAAIWQRPNNVGAACSLPSTLTPSTNAFANEIFFTNIGVRFPTNQRGNECGFCMWASGEISYDNVVADFNLSYNSIATGSAPVQGTAGNIGVAGSYSGSGNTQIFKDTYSTGYDLCYDLGEHTVGNQMTAIFCNTAAEFGRVTSVGHPSEITHFNDQENLNGINLHNMQLGSRVDFIDYALEMGSGNWYVRNNGKWTENTPGNSSGIITFTATLQGTGFLGNSGPAGLFTSGGQNFQLIYGNNAAAVVQPAVSDSFSRANAGTWGSAWQAVNSSCPSPAISSNSATVGSGVCLGRWNATTVPADQYSTGTVNTLDANGAGVFVRSASAATTYYDYICNGTAGGRQLRKRVAGVTTNLSTTASNCTTSNTLELDVIGSNLFAYYAGVLDLTASDTAITSGQPGLTVGGSGDSWKNWSGGPMLLADTSRSLASLPAVHPEYYTLTNCAAVGTGASPSVASCTAAAAGSFSCATNASGATCVVNTTAITANSEVFVQQRTDTTTGTRLGVTCNTGVSTVLPVVTAVSAGTSFTINLGTVNTNPECFSYWIVNQ